MALDIPLALAADDMEAVNAFILEQLASDVVLINQIGHYIINSGGKRLRPLLVLLASRAAGYEGKQHIDLAAIIEFIHTATLLHDDVVDGHAARRDRVVGRHHEREARIGSGERRRRRSGRRRVTCEQETAAQQGDSGGEHHHRCDQQEPELRRARTKQPTDCEQGKQRSKERQAESRCVMHETHDQKNSW